MTEPKHKSRGFEVDGVYTTGAVARLFHVAPRTVGLWLDRGRLKGYRLPTGNGEHDYTGDRRFRREDLIAFAKAYGLPMPRELLKFTIRPLIILFNFDKVIESRLTVSLSGQVQVINDPFEFGGVVSSTEEGLISHCIIGDAEGQKIAYQAAELTTVKRVNDCIVKVCVHPPIQAPTLRLYHIWSVPLDMDNFVNEINNEYKNLTQSRNLDI